MTRSIFFGTIAFARMLCMIFKRLHLLIPLLAINFNAFVVDAGEIQFNRDILPILADKCFACHGPDDSHRKADLRLDTREGALADLGGHVAVAPGAPGKSELLTRITTDDEDDLMPQDGDPLAPKPPASVYSKHQIEAHTGRKDTHHDRVYAEWRTGDL